MALSLRDLNRTTKGTSAELKIIGSHGEAGRGMMPAVGSARSHTTGSLSPPGLLLTQQILQARSELNEERARERESKRERKRERGSEKWVKA
jgi:hypothetical protein